MKQWPNKDPQDVSDFGIDWTLDLAVSEDTIDTSTWEVDKDTIAIDSDDNTTVIAKVWLSGGAVGETYKFTNRIVTVGGRTFERSVLLYVENR